MTKTRAILSLLLAAAAAAPAAPWAVPEASLRFDFTVAAPPSVPEAGVLAVIPDGNLLPSAPRPVVLDAAGKALAFEPVWHNPAEGLALVVARPPAAGFSVYIGRQSKLTAPGKSAFTAGPFFYVKTGDAGIETANRLQAGSPPGRDSVMGKVSLIGQQENPFGQDQDFSGWFTGWLQIDKPGKYYFATISDEGSLFRIGGKSVEWAAPHARQAGAKGQFGAWVDLTAGAHPVDYFYFNLAGPSEAQLVWRLPGSTNGLPALVPASAWRQSGTARLTAVADKENGPVALPAAACESYLWFGEQPDNLFRLSPRYPEANPPDTVYEWRLDDGRTVRETNFHWLFEGSAPRTVTLTARSGKKSSTASVTVRLNTTPPAARADNPAQRQTYRTALLTRCRSVAPPARPAADWHAGLWQVLVNVAEPFKGQGLFDALFERSREDLVAALAPEERYALEELFLDNLRYSDVPRAAAWIDRLEKEEKHPDRKRYWTLEKVELALYQAADTNLARQTAATLAAQAPGTEAGVLALVRLGDIEALAGRFDEARAQYAKAQALTPRKAGAPPPAAAPGPAGPPGGGGLAKTRDELNKADSGLARNRDALEADRNRKPPATTGRGVPPPLRKVDPWKAEAVRGGAYYETIRDLLQKGYRREARQELRNWELELPTEKLGGEYPVAEAEYFLALKDYARARLILATYRAAVDISPFMPRAMGMELDCLRRLGRHDEAAALADIVLRRFPGHPVAEQARVSKAAAAYAKPAPNPDVEAP